MRLRLLRPGAVEIWYTLTTHGECQRRADEYLAILSEDERERHDAFRFDQHRHLYRVSHALLRTVLSQYCDVRPADWQFEQGPHGRPEIKMSGEDPRLRFSLSHTDGLAACAVTLDAAIGLDVEAVDRELPIMTMADRVLSPPERQDLARRSGADQRERFFEYWTLKEAYVKAVGAGLSLPLQSISFRIGHEHGAQVMFDWPIPDKQERWRFWQMRPSERHHVALAVSTEVPDAKFAAFEYVPSGSTLTFPSLV